MRIEWHASWKACAGVNYDAGLEVSVASSFSTCFTLINLLSGPGGDGHSDDRGENGYGPALCFIIHQKKRFSLYLHHESTRHLDVC